MKFSVCQRIKRIKRTCSVSVRGTEGYDGSVAPPRNQCCRVETICFHSGAGFHKVLAPVPASTTATVNIVLAPCSFGPTALPATQNCTTFKNSLHWGNIGLDWVPWRKAISPEDKPDQSIPGHMTQLARITCLEMWDSYPCLI